jgi:hypothetical protein
VTVSASGLLTDLVLRERWHPQPLPEVAAEIMDCVRRAQARIPELLRQAMSETVGADPASHLLVADARRRFPEPEPHEPRHAPVQRRDSRAPQRDSTDDWDEREVMEDV